MKFTLKDARRTADGWQWEKKWHPELPKPEAAFPQHLAVVERHLQDLG